MLPLYATKMGEIISGHQRHHVSKRMGLEKVPVTWMDNMDLQRRKAINVQFNRGTNDMASHDNGKNLSKKFDQYDINDIANEIPDKKPEEMYPCLNAEDYSVKELIQVNIENFKNYSATVANLLMRNNVYMPIVVQKSNLQVKNGIGRLQMFGEKDKETIKTVFVDDNEALFSEIMLNYLTMDFNIHERYADLLRYNSFRRNYQKRWGLGKCHTFALIGSGVSANKFDIHNPSDRKRWIRKYGKYVLDFGAGKYCESDMLNEFENITCIPFEPYRLETTEINKELSLESANQFLDELEKKKEFNTIFLNSIMNSVPFLKDRLHIVEILKSLCGKRTTLYALSVGNHKSHHRHVIGHKYMNEEKKRMTSFLLEYETGVTIGELNGKPKMQKFHTGKEFYELFKNGFEKVKVQKGSGTYDAICKKPKPIDKQALIEALEFEFELPYPDGSRMGLSHRAKEAFGNRLNIDLKS